MPSECPWFVEQLRASGGAMDRDCIDYAVSLCRERKLAIDVGAHIGTWSKPLSELFERVDAYEPNLEMHQYFTNNVYRDNVRLSAIALGQERDEVALSNGVNSGQTHVTLGKGVRMDSLDNLYVRDRISFLKIDTEGMDYRVILGGHMVIARDKPVIVIEENVLARRYGYEIQDARKLLESWGMRVAKRFGENIVMTWVERDAD